MESGRHGQAQQPPHYLVEEEYAIEVPLFRPKPAFLSLLRLAGATGDVFTKKEILQYLKDYISSRHLFDCEDPRIVHCKDDLLGDIFSLNQFTIDDVLGLLDKNCVPVPDTLLKRTRHLVPKPLHKQASSVTIVCHAGSSQTPAPLITSTSGTKQTTNTCDKHKCNTTNEILVNRLCSDHRKRTCLADISDKACCKPSSLAVKLSSFRPASKLPHTKTRLSSSSSLSDKQSESTNSSASSLTNPVTAATHSQANQKTHDANNGVCHKKKCKRKKKRKSKSTVDGEPGRKRHQTEPCMDRLQEAAGPSRLPRQRGTSLSITYGGDRSAEKEEEPWYLELELADSEHQDTDHDGYTSDVLSVQDRETVRVQDSPDDLWFLEDDNHSIAVHVPSDTDFSVEYDIDSAISPSLTESDINSVKSAGSLLVVCQESDVEFFADYSDFDSNDGDRELSEADNWCCAECKNINHPFQRYCGKCWKVRSDWLPSQQLPSATMFTDHDDVKPVCPPNTGSVESSKYGQDSGVGSVSSTQPSSQETIHSDVILHQADNITDILKDTDTTEAPSSKALDLPSLADFGGHTVMPLSTESRSLESRYSFTNLQTNRENMSTPVLDSNDPDSKGDPLKSDASFKVTGSAAEEPCMICLSRPKTASLIHGSSGHQVCCFTCAKRLKRHGKVCPVCRRPIQKVVKNYIL